MRGLKKLGLIGAASIGLIAALLMITQALGQAGTLSVTDASTTVGSTASVDLVSDISGEGIDLWTIVIQYDGQLLAAQNCDGQAGSTCDLDFAAGPTMVALRVMGESESGIAGPTVLATITFLCEGEGTSTLDIQLERIRATGAAEEGGILGDIVPGEFVCEKASTAVALPETGFGDSGSSGAGTAWIIVALATAVLAGMAGFVALKVRHN